LLDGHESRPLIRKKIGDFLFSYGSFPDEDVPQVEGYETEFFTAPPEDRMGDRYRTIALVSAEKIGPIFLDLCALLPPHVSVVVERASEDVYLDRDVFISDIEVDAEDFIEVFKAYEFTFCEDGNIGVGAFAPDQPFEVFLSDHKEIVVYAEDAAVVHEVLGRHGVRSRKLAYYYDHPHQHVSLVEYRGFRGGQFDYVHVVEAMRQVFRMSQRLEDDVAVDEDGRPLGLVPWRAYVVAHAVRRARSSRRGQRSFGQEFLLMAETRREARRLLEDRLERDGYSLENVSELFRFDLMALPRDVRPAPAVLEKPGIWFVGDRRETPEMGWH
jgi:hypothetical protein